LIEDQDEKEGGEGRMGRARGGGKVVGYDERRPLTAEE